MKDHRSHCPQNLFLEVLGDKWALLIIRDMMIGGKHYFREFLQSKEKIASNILSARLKLLEDEGIVYKKPDPDHKQKIRYYLTEKGIDLFPILMENARWSLRHKPVDPEDGRIVREILEGGEAKISEMMEDMRKTHLRQ